MAVGLMLCFEQNVIICVGTYMQQSFLFVLRE
ncbi:hypothetical protein X566_23215 [Afipia sp. P52-10]|nr:hypothetical protein X566_23215 [Afipia sp. P52-10]